MKLSDEIINSLSINLRKKINNIKILKETLEYMEDEDRENIYEIFKLLIKEIILLNKDEINLKNDNLKLQIFLN